MANCVIFILFSLLWLRLSQLVIATKMSLFSRMWIGSAGQFLLTKTFRVFCDKFLGKKTNDDFYHLISFLLLTFHHPTSIWIWCKKLTKAKLKNITVHLGWRFGERAPNRVSSSGLLLSKKLKISVTFTHVSLNWDGFIWFYV